MNKLKVGDTAPEFAALTDQGDTLRLRDLRGKKVVLYFYPKDDTSGCTRQACHLRDEYPRIDQANAVILGVSPDGQGSHARFRRKYELPFTLLVDADHAISEAYGTWAEKSMYGRKYMGIIRSQFVIDEAGKLIDVRYKISPGDSAPTALSALGV